LYTLEGGEATETERREMNGTTRTVQQMVAGLALVVVLVGLVTQDASAAKKRHATIETRVTAAKDRCGLQNGTIGMDVSIKGNSVSAVDINCTGGDNRNWGCTITSKRMVCILTHEGMEQDPWAGLRRWATGVALCSGSRT